MPFARRISLLGALFALVASSALAIAHLAPGHRAGPYVAAHLALTAIALATYQTLRAHREHPDFQDALRTLCVATIVARVWLLPVAAFTTTDVARYLWDGAVALSGHDPYALAPAAGELAELARRFPQPIDHHDVATCYPPLALGLFATAAALGPSLAFYGWKLLITAASSLTVYFAWRAMRGGPHPERFALLAMSPLLVLESGVGAHLDTFTTLFALLALTHAQRGRWSLSALAVGCAAAAKLIPALLIVPLFVRAPRKVRFALLAMLPLGATMALALALKMTPPGSLGAVAQNWSFAAPLWTLLYHYFPFDDERTRAALAAFGLLAVGALSLRRGAIERNLRDAFGALLLVSPVLYPWYGAPLAALSAFAPSAWAWALLTALPLSYEVLDGFQATGRWHPHHWPMAVLVASVALGLVTDGARWWRSRRAR